MLGEGKAEPVLTPRTVVQATCQTLGFRPTEAQVAFGIREVAALCAGGFTLPEIDEGARYAAEQGWVRSFAGVKFYLPQALNAIALKARGDVETGYSGLQDTAQSGGDAVDRCQAAELSPHRAFWEQVLERVEPRISRQSYRTWFEPTFIAEYDGQSVVLDTPSAFFQQWIESHYLVLITSAFEEVLGRSVEVTVCASTGEPGGGVASATSATSATSADHPEGGG